MSGFLNKLRAWIFIPADIANHVLWGLGLYLIGSNLARFLGREHWVNVAAGILTAGFVAVTWETINHRADPENPFDPRDVAAGLGGAFLGALSAYP